MESKSIELKITGMSCMSCVKTIEKKLGLNPAVDSVQVNFDLKKAIVNLKTTLDPKELTTALDEIGFEAEAQ